VQCLTLYDSLDDLVEERTFLAKYGGISLLESADLSFHERQAYVKTVRDRETEDRKAKTKLEESKMKAIAKIFGGRKRR